MIDKIKHYLGIEGVSISIQLSKDKKHRGDEGVVEGIVVVKTLRDSVVQNIVFKVMERYERGRGSSKLINEYVVGYSEIEQNIAIGKGQEITIPFACPYKVKLSEIDKIGRNNVLLKGFSSAAKLIKGAKSSFRIVAEANVEGTKLLPLAEAHVNILV